MTLLVIFLLYTSEYLQGDSLYLIRAVFLKKKIKIYFILFPKLQDMKTITFVSCVPWCFHQMSSTQPENIFPHYDIIKITPI